MSYPKLDKVSELLVRSGCTSHLTRDQWAILEHQAALMEDEEEDAARKARIRRAAMIAAGGAALAGGAAYGTHKLLNSPRMLAHMQKLADLDQDNVKAQMLRNFGKAGLAYAQKGREFDQAVGQAAKAVNQHAQNAYGNVIQHAQNLNNKAVDIADQGIKKVKNLFNR